MKCLVTVNEKVRIIKISAGVDMSTAVSTTGQTYSWGAMKGGRIGLGMSNSYVTVPRRVMIKDADGQLLRAVDVDCGYVHSLIVGLNGTIHLCGGVGIDGEADGQVDEKNNDSDCAAPGTVFVDLPVSLSPLHCDYLTTPFVFQYRLPTSYTRLQHLASC